MGSQKQEDKTEKDMAQREEALAAREKELAVKEEALAKQAGPLTGWAEKLEKRETELAEREKLLAEPAVLVSTEDDEPELSDADRALIEKALKAYGIAPEHAIGTNIDRDTGEAVIVTNGGKKVRFAKGQKDVEPLNEIEISGINPKAKKRKPIAGKAKA